MNSVFAFRSSYRSRTVFNATARLLPTIAVMAASRSPATTASRSPRRPMSHSARGGRILAKAPGRSGPVDEYPSPHSILSQLVNGRTLWSRSDIFLKRYFIAASRLMGGFGNPLAIIWTAHPLSRRHRLIPAGSSTSGQKPDLRPRRARRRATNASCVSNWP